MGKTVWYKDIDRTIEVNQCPNCGEESFISVPGNTNGRCEICGIVRDKEGNEFWPE